MSDHKQDGVFNDSSSGSPSEVDTSSLAESVDSSQPDTSRPSRIRSDEVLDLITSVENQLEQMRSAQSDRVTEIESLETRRSRIDEQAGLIEGRQQQLAQGERDLQARLEEFNAEFEEFSERKHDMEEASARHLTDVDECARRTSELDQREQKFDAMIQEIDQQRSEIEDSSRRLEQDQSKFASERSEIEEDIRSSESAMEAYQSRCGELEGEVGKLRDRHDEIASRLEQSQTEFSDSENQRSDLQAELEQFRNDTLDLSGKLESAAECIDELELNLESARGELRAIESERDSALEVVSDRDQELSELQSNLELAMNRLQSLASAVAEQGPQLEEGAAAIALCRTQQDRLSALSTELESVRTQLQDPALTDPEGAVSEARSEIDRLRTDLEDSIPVDEHHRVVSALESRLASTPKAGGMSADDENAFKAQLAEARAEVQVLQSHAAACETAITEGKQKLIELQERNELLENAESIVTDGLPEDAVRLREQAQRLSSFALHLQRRRSRLHSVRAALHERGQSAVGSLTIDADQDRATRAGQEDLLRRRHELADLESQMMRRWASHGSVASVVRVATLLLIVAAASWFGVRFFAPGPVTTTALVRAQPVAGASLDPERAEAWNIWHEAILKDPIFAKQVTERLAASPAGFTGGVKRLSGMLASGLSVTAPQPGLLQIKFDGTSRSESTRILENVVTTLAGESQRQLPRRGDSARAEVLPSDGRLVTLDPIPVTGSQIQNAGFVFGGSVGVIGLLGAGIYSRLRRSKRLFDENMGLEDSFVD
jgi:chromosome segregation ATPase